MALQNIKGLKNLTFFLLILILISPFAISTRIDTTQNLVCIINENSEDRTCTVLGQEYKFLGPTFLCGNKHSGDVSIQQITAKEYPGTSED